MSKTAKTYFSVSNFTYPVTSYTMVGVIFP